MKGISTHASKQKKCEIGPLENEGTLETDLKEIGDNQTIIRP